MRVAIFLGVLLTTLLSVGGAQAADRRPKPPAQLCIGSDCVATPESGGKIKWNPGHYAAGNGWLTGGKSASSWYASMDGALANYPLFKGFRLWVTWGALEKSKGVYDFSQVDAILNRLKTQYGTPRRLVLTLYPSTPNKWSSSSNYSVIPTYIMQGKEYGPSPVAGSYGWWGPVTNGQLGSGYEPALWRPAVMDRFIALIQAIGAHYDNDPYVEAVMFQEGIYHTLSIGSDYTHPAMLDQVKRLLTASVAALPHTSVIYENSYGFGGATVNQNFTLWMVENRIAPGTADSFGETAFKLGYAPPVSWGIAAYMGMVSSGSSYSGGDLRDRSRAMVDVEADDIAGSYFQKWGGPYTPADICAAMNSQYKASHGFWDHFMGTETVKGLPLPEAAKWPNLAAALAKCPLTNTSYPPNYP
jgi:hypothetical protein